MRWRSPREWGVRGRPRAAPLRNARLVLADDCYQGVAKLVETGARDRGWQVERLPVADERWLQRAGEADMLWLESPSNPLLEVADLAAICAAPRRDGTKLVVDNTFATPLQQRPLQLGADVVVHSATKFLGGHSDLLLGVAVTQRPDQLDSMRRARQSPARRQERSSAFSPCVECVPAAATASGVGHRRGAGVSPRHGLGRRAGSLSRFRRHRELRASRCRCCRSGLPEHANHPSRDESRWRGDDHGAPQHPPRSGAHPRRPDPDERRLRGRRRPLGRPAIGAPEKLRPRSAFNYMS